MIARPARLVRAYLLVVGTILLLSGVGALVVHAVGIELAALQKPGFLTDPIHEWIHVGWGLAMLLPLARRASDAALSWLAVTFGLFYVGLGLIGVLVHQPLGLQLGLDENGFHLLVGPVALLLGAWALASARALARAVTSPDSALT